MRASVVYEREYTGSYSSRLFCRKLERSPEDTIDDWLVDNSLGLVDWNGEGHEGHLFVVNGVGYTIHSSVKDPSSLPLKSRGDFSYKRLVEIRVGSDTTFLPGVIKNALDERGLCKSERTYVEPDTKDL